MSNKFYKFYNQSIMYDKPSVLKKYDNNNCTDSNKILYKNNSINSQSNEILKVISNSKEKRLINCEIQNQQNKDYITRRMQQIRQKYSINKTNHNIRDKSINKKSIPKNIQLTNKSNNCKDNQNSIKLLKNVGNSCEKSSLVEYKSQILQKNPSIKNIKNTASVCDPRIQSIDKINQKIKSILKNISNQDYKISTESKDHKETQQNQRIQVAHKFQNGHKTFIKDNGKSEISMLLEQSIKKLKNEKSENQNVKIQKIYQKQKKQNILPKYYPNGKQQKKIPTSLGLKSLQNQQQSENKVKPQEQIGLKSYKSVSYQQHSKKDIRKQNKDQNPKKFHKQKKEKRIIIEDSNFQQKKLVEHQSLISKEQSLNPKQQIINPKEQTNRLIKFLKKQVELDEVYRNKKYAFKEIKDVNKIINLLNSIKKLGIQITEEALIRQITISQSQYNPFYTFREDTDYDLIAEAYKQSTNHWKNFIIGNFKRQKLIQEDLQDQILIFDKKGYLNIEDFVRMLNNSSDSFYRNRDLVLIFRRLSSNQKLEFKNFLDLICPRI